MKGHSGVKGNVTGMEGYGYIYMEQRKLGKRDRERPTWGCALNSKKQKKSNYL